MSDLTLNQASSRWALRWKQIRQSHVWHSFTRDRVAMVSAFIFVMIVAGALLAPVIAPTNPYNLSNIDIMDSEIAPSWSEEGDERFLLGTDAQGRDMFSTILYGARISIAIGFFAVVLQAFIGIVVGLIAGYRGGRVDNFLMRMADIQLSFSTMMVAIIVLAVFQASFGTELYSKLAMWMLILVIGIAEWPQYARTIRASVLAEKKKEYVEAAKVMGWQGEERGEVGWQGEERGEMGWQGEERGEVGWQGEERGEMGWQGEERGEMGWRGRREERDGLMREGRGMSW
jgi:peptide/nickel transport system permease protein